MIAMEPLKTKRNTEHRMSKRVAYGLPLPKALLAELALDLFSDVFGSMIVQRHALFGDQLHRPMEEIAVPDQILTRVSIWCLGLLCCRSWDSEGV